MEYTDKGRIKLIRAVLSGDITSSKQVFPNINDNDREDIFREIKYLSRPESIPPEDGKLLIVIGAGPISGKSTLRHMLLERLKQKKGGDSTAVITSEVLRQTIPEYSILRNVDKNQNAITELNLKSWDINDIRLSSYDFVRGEVTQFRDRFICEAIEEGRPIVLESHMSKPSNISKILNAAKRNGYETILLSPTVDVEQIFERGNKRLEETGKRFVVEGVLRHQKEFEEHWEGYTRMFDLAVRLDNNGEAPYPVALAVNGEITIIDEAAYERARQKIGINPAGKTASEIFPQERRFEKPERSKQGRMEGINGEGEARRFEGWVNTKSGFISSIVKGIDRNGDLMKQR